MSRRVPTDHKFNKERLAKLIGEAKGEGRSQKDFARYTGLSAAYINRCLKANLENSPSPKTLYSIASASKQRVSFEDLLDAAGYDPQKYVDSFNTTINMDNYIVFARETIRDVLERIDIKAEIVHDVYDAEDVNDYPTINTFTVHPAEGYISEWVFYLFPPYSQAAAFWKLYGILQQFMIKMYSDKDEHFQLSILTMNEDGFYDILMTVPYLDYWVSVLLFKPFARSIVFEQYANIIEKGRGKIDDSDIQYAAYKMSRYALALGIKYWCKQTNVIPFNKIRVQEEEE